MEMVFKSINQYMEVFQITSFTLLEVINHLEH